MDRRYTNMEIKTKDELIEIINSLKCGVIGIDGGSGSGKSSLSKKISEATGAKVFHLDDFINEKKVGYFIDIDKLRKSVTTYEGVVIIEGCCLQKILKMADLSTSINIYVKEMNLGLWLREEIYDITGANGCLKKVLDQENEKLSAVELVFPESPMQKIDNTKHNFISKLNKEIIIYHYEYKPHKKTNYIYERHARGTEG